MADMSGTLTGLPAGVTKVYGFTNTSFESLTSNFEFLTLTTAVDIRTASQGGGTTASQANLDKLIQVVSERGQPVIMGAISAASSTAFTGYMAGTTGLTTTATSPGTPVIGQIISGPGVSAGTMIVSGSGTSWVTNQSQTFGSSGSQVALSGYEPPFTVILAIEHPSAWGCVLGVVGSQLTDRIANDGINYGFGNVAFTGSTSTTTLTVATVTGTPFVVGQTISGVGLAAGTTITAFGTGTGGTGTYTVAPSQATLGTQAMSAGQIAVTYSSVMT
jgi:hypothetical protein